MAPGAGYVPVTKAGYEETIKSGFYEKNLELTLRSNSSM